MNKEKINQFLTEQMGECWHDYWENEAVKICRKCGDGRSHLQSNNFITWEGFGKLKSFIDKKEWADHFYRGIFVVIRGMLQNLTPEVFAITLAEYLGYKE